MIPSRPARDILSRMWALICGIGQGPRGCCGGSGVRDRRQRAGSTLAAAFVGTLPPRSSWLAPPWDPEFKGMVERSKGPYGHVDKMERLAIGNLSSPRGGQRRGKIGVQEPQVSSG